MSARILVVDDNPRNVKLLAAKLSRDYYAVLTAENGAEALQKISETGPYAVIVSDMRMPEMNGIELLRLLLLFSIFF